MTGALGRPLSRGSAPALARSLRVRDQRRPNRRLTANPVANAMAALRSGRVLSLLPRLPKSFRTESRSESSERRSLAGACLKSADLRFLDSRFRSWLDPVPLPGDRRGRGGARPFTSRPLLEDAARARAMSPPSPARFGHACELWVSRVVIRAGNVRLSARFQLSPPGAHRNPDRPRGTFGTA
jgi:hypothetical protein